MKWTTKDAAITWGDFDLEGRPRKTVQTRFKDSSGFSGAIIFDEYTQEHTWNELGERTSWTMPSYTGLTPAGGWTKSVSEERDACGNVAKMTRR